MSDQDPTDADFEQYADQDAEPPGNGITAPGSETNAPETDNPDQDAEPPGNGISSP